MPLPTKAYKSQHLPCHSSVSEMEQPPDFSVLPSFLACWLQVSEGLLKDVHDCFHLTETLGSDHCPIGLVLKTT